MQHDHVLKKLNFDLLTPSPGRGEGEWGRWQNICYHVAAFHDSHKFDMQHDHVLKKMNFDLLTPKPPRPGGGGVCKQNIYYHVAAFVIPFTLICNMTML